MSDGGGLKKYCSVSAKRNWKMNVSNIDPVMAKFIWLHINLEDNFWSQVRFNGDVQQHAQQHTLINTVRLKTEASPIQPHVEVTEGLKYQFPVWAKRNWNRHLLGSTMRCATMSRICSPRGTPNAANSHVSSFMLVLLRAHPCASTHLSCKSLFVSSLKYFSIVFFNKFSFSMFFQQQVFLLFATIGLLFFFWGLCSSCQKKAFSFCKKRFVSMGLFCFTWAFFCLTWLFFFFNRLFLKVLFSNFSAFLISKNWFFCRKCVFRVFLHFSFLNISFFSMAFVFPIVLIFLVGFFFFKRFFFVQQISVQTFFHVFFFQCAFFQWTFCWWAFFQQAFFPNKFFFFQ